MALVEEKDVLSDAADVRIFGTDTVVARACGFAHPFEQL
jgi:hypothetical protein